MGRVTRALVVSCALVAAPAIAVVGCARAPGVIARTPPGLEPPFTGYASERYRDPKLVLLGHSQGAEMITRLLRKYFDGDGAAAKAMRERLLVAMPIGGRIEVKRGSDTGGTFQTLPLCTKSDQRACVVAYRSY